MKPRLPVTILCPIVLWSLPLSWTLAAATSFELAVDAGKHDRANTPVTVLVDLPAEAKSVSLTDEQGNTLPAQLTAPGLLSREARGKRELHFIVPKLEKGGSLKLKAVVSKDPPAQKGFGFKHAEGEYLELSYDGRPVLRYVCKAFDPQHRDETNKVFHHVCNPAGTRFVTKGPGGMDSHHRGLYFAYGHCEYEGGRANMWAPGGDSHQAHDGLLAEESGRVLGRHRVAVGWRGGDRKAFATEQRELTVYAVPGGQLIEFATRLCTAGGKVTLGGNQHHAGFQFRAAQEVAAKTSAQTCFLRADGRGEPGQARNAGRGDTRCDNLPWNAMSFVIEGKRYTALYIDNPANPKPATYSERTYGRFGSYFPFELEKGKPLEASYRTWVQDGEMDVEQAAALSADFAQPPTVTIK